MSRPDPPLAYQLYALPPRVEDVTPDDVLERFLAYVKELGLELYPAQEEAVLEILAGKNVILATPTGSGKSLVAAALHFFALAQKKRSFYTSPIKALASEKFFALCKDFGAEYVGMITGDAAINRDAPLVCCTAEILANIALREGQDALVDYAVLDEFHYYADKDRGVAWQLPLLALPQTQFLLMSATLGDTSFFEEKLTELTGRETVTIKSAHRPVPLDFSYKETPLHETIQTLIKEGKAPVYVVNFTQRGAAEEAQNLMSTDFSSKDEKKAIAAALTGFRFDSPYGKEVQKFVKHGVGVHHAGLLPKYRLMVEKLAQKGLLKIICGTDTLGVGVNIPIRTVLLTKLCKFDGEKTAILSVRDFRQISGRAGRRGFDTQGSVVVQAPEHAIENLRLEAKAGSDPVKKKRIVRKKPPDKGYVHWDKATFDRLIAGEPEARQSRFQVSHGMLLNVLARPSGGCKAMARILKKSHERPAQQRIHGKTAMQMFKSLKDAGIVEEGPGHRVRVNADLQEDFSLNHALSLYLLETIDKLDRENNELYPLDLLTLVESILENPEIVLMRQLDKLKTEKMAEMKAAGVEYDDRIAELEKLEYPKPNRDFIYDTYNAFAKKHPWVGTENIRPKSIARDMHEQFMSFPEYVKEYGLERTEGALLRYLADVYKVLVQTVPDTAKDDGVHEVITYFRAIVRAVDSSLLDEWERMRGLSPETAERPVEDALPGEVDVTTNEKDFTVLVRNAMFSLVRALARKEYELAATMVEPSPSEPWNAERFKQAMAPFFEEHAAMRVDPKARIPENTRIEKKEGAWRVEQIVCDAEDDNDWVIVADVDLRRSADEARPVLAIARIGK